MITMRFGSSEILGTRLKDEAGEPLADATVTYEILDKAGSVRASGTLQRNEEQDGSDGAAYEDELHTDDFVDLAAVNYARPKPQNFKAKIVAVGGAAEEGESLIRIHVHHDID